MTKQQRDKLNECIDLLVSNGDLISCNVATTINELIREDVINEVTK